MDEKQCTWCGKTAPADDRFEIYERAGERIAMFCRLEHVVPWTIRGAHWDAVQSRPDFPDGGSCSYCSAALPDTRIDMLRMRAGVVVNDSFCGVEHLAAWAKAGGRFATR